MFWAKCRQFLSAVGALALSVSLVFCVWIMGREIFPTLQGERTYYLHSPSSQARVTRAPTIRELFFIEGESVQLSTSSEALQAVERFVQEMKGELLFQEEVGEVRSFYLFSPKVGGGIIIEGRLVNLHIAVGDGRCVVGSPIIFGGF